MDVGLALRNCSKGQLKYDKYWVEEGRTKEILDSISEYSRNISVRISPKVFPDIINDSPVLSKISSTTTEAKSSDKLITKVNEKFKKVNHPTDAYFYELQSEMELPLQEYEEERLKYIQGVFENKKNEFDNHSLEVQEQANQEYLLAKRKNDLDARRRTVELQKLEESLLKEAQELEKVQKEQYQSHVKKLSAKIHEAELKQKQAEEELKKRLQEQEELKFQLNTCFQEAKNIISKCVEKLNFCEHQNYLCVSKDERVKQMANLLEFINNLIAQSKNRDLTIDDILNANLHVQKACEILQEISSDIESAKVKASKQHEAALSAYSQGIVQHQMINNIKDSKTSDMQSSESVHPHKTTSELPSKSNDFIDEKKEAEKKVLSQFIAPDAIEHYEEILNNFKNMDVVVQSVRNDPKNKKYRFELQKAINVPINSLSSNSGSQIKVKINKLLSILTGKAPETSGRNLNQNSPIFKFCSYLIAKQFVEQGDTQISSQHSTAFPIALAILGVWAKEPEVGRLILGHFYDKCPFLVPFYPPKEETQTNEDYFKSLGYRLEDDGTIEPKYKFLNRISGYVRLYAAIIQSSLPPNGRESHPHGIEWGWKWLSRILNIDPRPDITATILYDFLDVAGYALQKAYGKQFNKMLHILCKDYFQRIKQVTPGGSGGPLERLEIFLQQAAKTRRITPPEGMLDANFWVR